MDLSAVTVLCIGDLMLDRFFYCDMQRISPEAPVPVLRSSRTREMLGGIGNVANNIASLGGRAVLTGLVANDEYGRSLRSILLETPGITADLVETYERPTIGKTRFIAAGQHVVRVDEESALAQTAPEAAALLTVALSWIDRVDAVILSDYGKGVVQGSLIARLMDAARAAAVPVFVDPKQHDFALYRGAACITPNLKELAAASGKPVGTVEEVAAAARHVMEQADGAAILATRSEKGMVLVEATGEVHAVPARAREVFDVSGAGDTVIAALALCHAAQRSLSQAMHIANAAASVVVSKLGTATASMAEVMRELALQEQESDPTRASGVQSLTRVRESVLAWKQQGLIVGFTNGCFDILHPGHIALLAYARAECDRLVVGINSDASVRLLKGPARPINELGSRAQVIAALRHVDCIVAFDEATPIELIRGLLPNVLVKGADYTVDQVVGADLVQAVGGRVLLAPLMPDHSTTGLVGRLQYASTE